MPLNIDTEFAAAIQAMATGFSLKPPRPNDFEGGRKFHDDLMSILNERLPTSGDVEVSQFFASAPDGYKVSVYRFHRRGDIFSGAPAILHCHGGGMVSGSVLSSQKALAAQVSRTGVQFFSVEYRLAPEHRHPTLTEDVYAALIWLRENCEQLGVDPTHIAVMGESAGGGIAAGVALLARDRGLSPPLAKHILIYPMLDDHTSKPNGEIEPFATFTTENNVACWNALLEDKAGADDVPYYAAPARVESVEGLPPTYIDVGDLDIFRDEDIKYATRLALANVQTEFHLYPGVAHGFENGAPDIWITKCALENRRRAIMSF